MDLKIINGKKSKTLPIGVDLGSNSVKLAQLRLAEQEIELLAANSIDIPEDCQKDSAKKFDFLQNSIHNFLENKNYKGRECILSLPAEDSFVQHVKLSPTPTEKIPEALELELANKLPFPVEEAITRHIVAGESYVDGEAKKEVIVVAAKRNILASYLDMANKAGLDVVGINIEPCAIVECFSRLFRRKSDVNRTILYLDIGAQSTQIALSHGNRLVFARNLSMAGNDLDKAIADGMNVSLSQAHSIRWDLLKTEGPKQAEDELYRLLDSQMSRMADEVNQCLHYYESVFRNKSIERAIFLGGQAYDKRLCQSIAKRLNIPSQIGDPLFRVKRIEGAEMAQGMDCSDPQPNWAVVIGLSLGASAA